MAGYESPVVKVRFLPSRGNTFTVLDNKLDEGLRARGTAQRGRGRNVLKVPSSGVDSLEEPR